ncbi:ComF family protein [Marichromatium bheemlicum]|uniref:ComF family protein n=1 Tax=Marichromatium bheemlicum TaxID=365339 RepID=A0ABX1I391_9GAMM|nr:ComF family protein [Marichromatium bheemlicum]NKN31742.1 ComF family protein [Marichromatium bheemlicum]
MALLQRLIWGLYPPTCVLCGAPGEAGFDLCAGCCAELPLNRYRCARCARPFDSDLGAGHWCGRCVAQPPPFAVCHAPLRYQGLVPGLIADLKFHARLDRAVLLGRLLAESRAALAPPLPELLVPVPLHPARQRARGYNQALELARVVGAALGVAVDPGLCLRVRATPPQVGQQRRARQRNIGPGAFALARALPARRLAIIDDVMTTGATVGALARVLTGAGAREIEVWVVARTP